MSWLLAGMLLVIVLLFVSFFVNLYLYDYYSKKVKEHEMEKYFLGAVLDSVRSVTVIVNNKREIMFCNQVFNELVGKNRVNGDNFVDFIHPENQEEVRDILNSWIVNRIHGKRMDLGDSFEAKMFNGEHYLWRSNRTVLSFGDGKDYVNYTVLHGIDISDQKMHEESLKEKSFNDTLTCTYNRNYMTELLKNPTRNLFPAIIIVADVDGLKYVNDNYGHDAGDNLIQASADILKNTVRDDDIVIRYGGDEFVLILPTANKETMEKIEKKMQKAIDRYNEDNPPVPLKISFGTEFCPNKDKFEKVFAIADQKMYERKIASKTVKQEDKPVEQKQQSLF